MLHLTTTYAEMKPSVRWPVIAKEIDCGRHENDDKLLETVSDSGSLPSTPAAS